MQQPIWQKRTVDQVIWLACGKMQVMQWHNDDSSWTAASIKGWITTKAGKIKVFHSEQEAKDAAIEETIKALWEDLTLLKDSNSPWFDLAE